MPTGWNAMPGHITTPATTGNPAVYKDRPDYTPPAALQVDPAATAVELANWRLEMDMHFAYTHHGQQGAGYHHIGQWGGV
jgi:hypothetical protein